MNIKQEEDLIIVTSDLDGLLITSEISPSRDLILTLEENDNVEQYFLDVNEINLLISHLEKSKEILQKSMQ
jgi:hypothetical protein